MAVFQSLMKILQAKISSSKYSTVRIYFEENWIETGDQDSSVESLRQCRSDCPAAYGKVGSVCIQCKANTYSDRDSITCANCSSTQQSLVGATKCTPGTC